MDDERAIAEVGFDECAPTIVAEPDCDAQRIVGVPNSGGQSENGCTVEGCVANASLACHETPVNDSSPTRVAMRTGVDATSMQPWKSRHVTNCAVDPRHPTDARPGSWEKVAVLAARYAAGVPLWCAKDHYAGSSEDEFE